MRRSAAVALAAALVGVVTGCGPTRTGPDSIASTTFPGFPSGAPTPSDIRASGTIAVPLPGAVAAFLSDGRLQLTTLGSGTCPAVPVGLLVRDEHTVEVTFSADYGSAAACSADISPTTSVVDLPGSVRAAESLTVRVRGESVSQAELTVQSS